MVEGKGPKIAQELFRSNYNCAQSTLAGVLAGFSRGYRSRMELACGFQAGIAQTGKMCGCLSGIIMAFGVIVPRKELSMADWKQLVSDISKAMISSFESEFGSIDCSMLTGYDMSNALNRKRFLIELGGRSTVCEPMVTRSVEIAIELLKEYKLRDWS